MPFQNASQALLHPRPPTLPAVRDQQHISAFSSAAGSVSLPFLSPVLAQLPAPPGETEVKCSTSCCSIALSPREKPKPPQSKLIPKTSADLLLADTGLAGGDLACLIALFPTMGKLQPQDPGVDIAGMQLGYSCSQKRGCNAAVNPTICLGSCRVIICLQ